MCSLDPLAPLLVDGQEQQQDYVCTRPTRHSWTPEQERPSRKYEGQQKVKYKGQYEEQYEINDIMKDFMADILMYSMKDSIKDVMKDNIYTLCKMI